MAFLKHHEGWSSIFNVHAQINLVQQPWTDDHPNRIWWQAHTSPRNITVLFSLNFRSKNLLHWWDFLEISPFRGGGGSGKNDHKFLFLTNIEFYRRSLTSFRGAEQCDLSLKQESPTDNTDLDFAAEHIARYLSSKDLENRMFSGTMRLERHCPVLYFPSVRTWSCWRGFNLAFHGHYHTLSRSNPWNFYLPRQRSRLYSPGSVWSSSHCSSAYLGD